jgi:protease IV
MRTAFCLVLPLFFVAMLSGCGTPSFLITPVATDFELHEEVVKSGNFGGGKVAILPIEGTLVDEKSGAFLQPQENPLSLFVQELDQAAEDDSVKAIVLRVNSPGGTVTSSDIMYDALVRFREKTHKPAIVSIQEVGASGAYYLSCGADKIVANPTSVVGSIGVIFETFDIVGTMDKIGVQPDTIKSAELKDMGSPFKHMTDHERAVMQALVDQYFARFKGVVTSNRHITDPDTLKLVTDGRVFSGVDALKLGLIDQVGRLNDAIDLAKQMANTPGAEVIMYRRAYGYSGTIYADTSVSPPASSSTDLTLRLPMDQSFVPMGFYYLWQP